MGVGHQPHIQDIFACNLISLLLGRTVVWIIGSSIIYWAQRRAFHRPGGENLGLHYRGVSIRWTGKRSMKWYEFTGTVEKALQKLPPPSFLLVQLGSNDIGTGVKTKSLIEDMERDILRIRLLLPNTKIIWSDILMRRYWSVADNPGDGPVIEGLRLRVNSAMRSYANKEGHYNIKHPNIRAKEKTLYRHDGCHLSDIGNDILLNTYQAALETFIANSEARSFPIE